MGGPAGRRARRGAGRGRGDRVVWGTGARSLSQAGNRVVEAQPPPALDRWGKGKSDALDAVRVARSVLGTQISQLRVPRTDGARNALRILLAARELITRERTATVNALTALVRTEDLGLYGHGREPVPATSDRRVARPDR